MLFIWSIGTGCVGKLWGHLEAHDISYVVDVRASSEKTRELARECFARGVMHDRPRALTWSDPGGRRRVERERARELYAPRLENPRAHQAMLELLGWAQGHRVAVVCDCRAHDRCHRGVLLDRLGDGVTVIKLGEDAPPPKQGSLF